MLIHKMFFKIPAGMNKEWRDNKMTQKINHLFKQAMLLLYYQSLKLTNINSDSPL